MNSKEDIHIALTGHRPTKLGGYDITTKEYKELQEDLEDIIQGYLEDYNVVWCHSGLALGADTVWSKAILNMRTEYPGRVLFHAEIPMMTQPSQWFVQDDIKFWKEQVETCDKHSLYSYTAPNERMDARMVSDALSKRNIGMVDHADVLIAIYDGSKSGTKQAFDYAKRNEKKIIHIYPSDYFK